MKKNESVTFSGVWIIKRGSIYLHPYQVKVIPYILNILLHTRSIYILIIRAKPSLGADYFLIPTPNLSVWEVRWSVVEKLLQRVVL